MKKHFIFQFGDDYLLKEYKGNWDDAKKEAMEFAKRLHDALLIPVRFFALTEQNAIIIE